MKEKTLTHQLMTRFAVCLALLFALSMPVFYFITVQYYAEDLYDIVSRYGIKDPHIDLKEDTLAGLFFQLSSVLVIISAAMFIIMRWVPQRLWRPFRHTLKRIATFNVETGIVPQLPDTDISEFRQLNDALTRIMTESVTSYKVQKEFTENASHELQTPLAIAQVKLDNLMQDESLTEPQAHVIQQVYDELRHMSQLSRNLLLLSKIENHQFKTDEKVDIADEMASLLPQLETIAGDLRIDLCDESHHYPTPCNQVLLDSLIANLVVNAVRHNTSDGYISLHVTDTELTVTNTSDEGPLNPDHVFSRFYRNQQNQKGNGLGLAIVKSICNYHHWTIGYRYCQGKHQFTVGWPTPQTDPDKTRATHAQQTLNEPTL